MKWKSPKSTSYQPDVGRMLCQGHIDDLKYGTYRHHPCGKMRHPSGSEPDFSCHLRQELRDVPGQLSLLFLTSGHPRMHHEKSRANAEFTERINIVLSDPPHLKMGYQCDQKECQTHQHSPNTTENHGLEHWSWLKNTGRWTFARHLHNLWEKQRFLFSISSWTKAYRDDFSWVSLLKFSDYHI